MIAAIAVVFSWGFSKRTDSEIVLETKAKKAEEVKH
jgi:hypothetical protein